MKLLKHVFLILVAAGFPALAMASEGSSTGNGGGTWVCQNNDVLGTIRWATLVDLYEARKEYKLNIPQENRELTVDEIVGLKKIRLLSASSDFYQRIEPYIDQVKQELVFVDADLQVIDDALYLIRPPQRECIDGQGQAGMIRYVQLANYTNYGKILIQQALWNDPRLSNTDRAALIYHEAIYAYFRETKGDKNSRNARELVGYIFSDLNDEALKQKLENLGESHPAPNLATMTFVPIRAGSFMMGSPTSEDGRYSNEKQHLVTITRGFEMGATEVTQSQWFQVMGNNPSHFSKYKNCPPMTPNDPNGYVAIDGVGMCPNNPVEKVSWDDAQVFITRLNSLKKDAYIYRLPTEAEWEYAARAGTSSAYSFGNDSSQLYQYGWFWGNSGSSYQTYAVASLKPNAWGLYDMHGNVSEFVQDWFTEDLTKLPSTDPVGPGSGSCRGVRGGSWWVNATFTRSAFRGCVSSWDRAFYWGLRLVRTK